MVPKREYIINCIPPPAMTEVKICEVQTAEQITQCVLQAVNNSMSYVPNYAHIFVNNTILDTCHDIWEFMVRNFDFNPEPRTLQTGRTVRYIIYDPIQNSNLLNLHGQRLGKKYFDCKHFSTFAFATCKSLGIKCELRLAAYPNSKNDETPTHVYCVAFNMAGEPIIIDGTLDNFNQESKSWIKYQVKEK